jgi:hypothetical protein
LVNIDPYALIHIIGGSSLTGGCSLVPDKDILYNILVEPGEVGTSIDASLPGT